MRRVVLWLMGTVTALVLLFGYHTSLSSTAAGGGTSLARPVHGGTSGGTGSSGGTSASSGGTAGSTGGTATGGRSITGEVAQTRWGPVQVRLSMASGRITAVDVVQYPNGNPRDQEINAQALPILIQETLSAQSANIDMVGGATVTSDGYLQSLQSALDQAGR